MVRDYLIPNVSQENLIDQYAYKATDSTTGALTNVTDTVGRMLENNHYMYVAC